MLIKWIERGFNFDFPADLYETIVVRLRFTPLRYRTVTKDLDKALLNEQRDGRWSIKENAGHIGLLDGTLWNGRLEQFMAGEERLMEADLTNRATSEAGFNAQQIKGILAFLEEERGKFIGHLNVLKREDFARTALHPRLNKQMRLVDMLYFMAEHDDYHLTHILKLANGAGC